VRLTASPTDSANDLLTRLGAEIAAHLDLRACWFEPFPFDASLPRIEQDRVVLPAGEPGVRPFADWQPGDGIELPVRVGALTLGRFVLVPHTPTCGVGLSAGTRAVAGGIAERAAAALAERIEHDWRVDAERGMVP